MPCSKCDVNIFKCHWEITFKRWLETEELRDIPENVGRMWCGTRLSTLDFSMFFDTVNYFISVSKLKSKQIYSFDITNHQHRTSFEWIRKFEISLSQINFWKLFPGAWFILSDIRLRHFLLVLIFHIEYAFNVHPAQSRFAVVVWRHWPNIIVIDCWG